MWIYNSDLNKWNRSDDRLSKIDFDYLKQELSSTKFYSRCLSGSTYIGANDLDNIYDILGSYKPRNWYVGITGSSYSISNVPYLNPTNISDSSIEDYNKYISEYGLTLKNLFTPDRIISDSVSNFKSVDLATTEQIDISAFTQSYIDGVRLVKGHKILIKDQYTTLTLLSTDDPKDYFNSNYEIVENLGATIEYKYYNSENGIYLYNGSGIEKTSDLVEYSDCIRLSVFVKLGVYNKEKQFFLSRLLDGYFPTTNLPIEFKESHNWLIRNRVDYNNLFEINYYDIIRSDAHYSYIGGNTYSIPTRIISIGEFGVILNYQEGHSNIIYNKYKVNLRSIHEVSNYYWVCGDDLTLLKIRKYDFKIEKINLDVKNIQIKKSLKSVSFFNDIYGVIVGELNTIFYTEDGGYNWAKIEVEDFNGFNYNKVLYTSINNFYIGGDTGVFIEMKNDLSGWTSYKRRIYKSVDEDDEYLLVDNINDLYNTNLTSWGVSYSFFTQSIASDKNLIFIASNSSIIAYDVDNVFSNISDFIYFDSTYNNYDITNIYKKGSSNKFYFTGGSKSDGYGIYSMNLDSFIYLGTGGSFSNSISGPINFESSLYPNSISDYNSQEMLICGNDSLLGTSSYSTISISSIDDIIDRLKPKMIFLDYDISSKLNFFKDNGEYRLPDSITFSSSLINSTGKYIGFSPIVHNETSTNGGTYSEVNWIQYNIDSLKTFKFYSTAPLDESTKVLISNTFSYTSDLTTISTTGNSVTGTYSMMYNLAPGISNFTQSRYDGQGGVAISAPSSMYDIYLYDYLMIIRTSLLFASSVGDMIRIESDVIEDQFVINRIEEFGSYRYLYLFTNFNDGIIKDLQSSSSITIINLNRYGSVNELDYRFNLHEISNGYNLSVSSSTIEISSKFNNLTSYYNMASNVILDGSTQSMIYTDGFLRFGYSPTYNIMDYLININDPNDINPKFYYNKEYLSMPVYEGLPLGSLTSSTVYIDYNGLTYSGGNITMPGNKVNIGSGLKIVWETLFINTFVDITIYGASTYETNRLLIINKYYESSTDSYVLEFHKNIDFTLYDTLIGSGTIDIKSRRQLHQISSDLQEFNNIQKTKNRKNSWSDQGTYEYSSYQNELNFKVPTDSYAKILLSDVDTVKSLSAIVYIDYKNELAMNITMLGDDYKIPITNTSNFSGKLYISCSEKHNLLTGDSVVLEFNGGTYSSQEMNKQYFGYHVITKVTDFDFLTDINYGSVPLVGNDIGYAIYNNTDPFLNYQPIDLIDIGTDKFGKISIELSTDNLYLNDGKYSLVDIDYSRYRFRLIDGLTLESISKNFHWILEAEVSDALIGIESNKIVWYSGTWLYGRWFGGIWNSGTWMSGDWYSGVWNSNIVKDNVISANIDKKTIDNSKSIWLGGRWYDGVWNSGTWYNGRWYGGVHNSGDWYRGTWNDGVWNDGTFKGGIWVDGVWNSGIFNCNNESSYWLDGYWNSGDFENGIWYNGIFKEGRFGTKSFNSRTSIWHGGKWISGSFFSRLDLIMGTSKTHKYSVWMTGQWLSGDWYGGIAYNMDLKKGNWYGGILEDIEIIGIDVNNNTFDLNGIFRFNIGDEVYVLDNQINNSNSILGSNADPGKYKVLNVLVDDLSSVTKIYLDGDFSTVGASSSNVDTGLRLVSNVKNLNWKSGIWTNGIFDSGLWESGIWYNGNFSGTWS